MEGSACPGPKCDQPLHGFLNPTDYVGVSFWIISISMVAATVFFLYESTSVNLHWKTSMNVGALVTLVAGVHYFYMREFWLTFHSSPILYRYIDWSITVPLQMIEFYLILSAVKPDIGVGMFWRLLVGTIVMLASGYAGEAEFIPAILGFIFGMCGWFYILHEVGVDFQQYIGSEKVAQIKDKVHPKLLDILEKSGVGEAGSIVAGSEIMNEEVKYAYQTMRFIVTVGWSIYPLGYFFGYLLGAVQDNVLNLIYNLADFVNKIAFCLAIWHAAKKSSMKAEC
jgi:bacteriorhodopsin